jgi:hypothetical protein
VQSCVVEPAEDGHALVERLARDETRGAHASSVLLDEPLEPRALLRRRPRRREPTPRGRCCGSGGRRSRGRTSA